MTQVFISYSRKDLPFVENLVSDLKDSGLDVWYDLSGLDGGSRWRISIEKAIKASQYVILVLSPDSVASEWVEEEILYAKKLKRKIIPLLYKDCDLPLGYQARHVINIQGKKYEKNYNNILRALDVTPVYPDLSSNIIEETPKIPDFPPAWQEIYSKRNDKDLSTNQEKKQNKNRVWFLLIPIIVIIVIAIFSQLDDAPPFLVTPTNTYTPNFTPSPTHNSTITPSTPNNIPMASFTLTAFPSITPSQLPTPIVFAVRILEGGAVQNCRSSPNTSLGQVVEEIAPGEELLAFGRTEDGDWLYIKFEDTAENITEFCWVFAAGTAHDKGQIAILPLGLTESKKAEMVLVPSGRFSMGEQITTLVDTCKSIDSIKGNCNVEFFNDITMRDLVIESFYIDKYEVSNSQYKECVDSGICSPPTSTKSKTRDKYYGNPQYDNYPVIYVNWQMANTFCQEWRGDRLPSEAEWEKASRGLDGRLFPWGNDFSGREANFCDIYCTTGTNYDDGSRDTAPTMSYNEGMSPYNLYNMSGNVWEWVQDQYENDYRMVFRGGSWSYPVYSLFSANRGYNSQDYSEDNIGFRCAKDATP